MLAALLLCTLLAARPVAGGAPAAPLPGGAATAAADVTAATLKPTTAQLNSLAAMCGQAAFPADCATKCTIRNCLVCQAGRCLCCDRGFTPSANGRACQACPFPFTTTRPGCTKCDGEALLHMRDWACRAAGPGTASAPAAHHLPSRKAALLRCRPPALTPSRPQTLPAGCNPGWCGPNCGPCPLGTWCAGGPFTQASTCQACPACPRVACKIAAPCDVRSGACRYTSAANGTACLLSNAAPGQCLGGMCEVCGPRAIAERCWAARTAQWAAPACARLSLQPL